jgi:hypothetical protein
MQHSIAIFLYYKGSFYVKHLSGTTPFFGDFGDFGEVDTYP